jgi:hypothetical protein
MQNIGMVPEGLKRDPFIGSCDGRPRPRNAPE